MVAYFPEIINNASGFNWKVWLHIKVGDKNEFAMAGTVKMWYYWYACERTQMI